MFSESNVITEFEKKLDREIDHIRSQIITIKTGKASPTFVEGLVVNAYDSTLRLMELATITTSGPSQLLIAPFDQSIIVAIEKAILASPLHLTPRVEAGKIYITIPMLTEDQRKQLLKTVSQKIEEGRVGLRNHRDEVRRKVRAAEGAKEITEDDRFRLEKKIDTLTQDSTARFDEMKEKKEKEIMTV